VRIVFLGTPDSAIPPLTALLSAGHLVSLVVTQPDRPAGRSGSPRPPAVKSAALRDGLPVIQPAKVRVPAFREAIAAEQPDALVVVAYGRILPEAVLAVARLGAVNLHFSLLPRHRGAAPVQWAISSGDGVTGVTTMLMNARMDEGDLLLQREVPVEPGEHAPPLTARLAAVGSGLLVETLSGLARGTIAPRPQDPALASYAPPLAPADGQADPSAPAGTIERLVRAFDPWPGVWLRHAGRRIRIVDARAIDGLSHAGPAGTLTGLESGDLGMACGGGTLLAIRELQPEGRRVMSARDALNGRHLAPGDRLERIS
jgi:methionyl-tRNA formyltransferase